MKRLLGSLFLITLVLSIGVVLVIYAKGNRLDTDGKLVSIGILQVDTTPNGARVTINGEYRGESDINIENLKPDKYTIRIEKDRYQAWEKIVEVKEGLVTPLRVSLFPTNPSLTALTFDGVYSPLISPDNKKVVYGIHQKEKKGLWVLSLKDRQLFFNNSSPRQIVADTQELPFSSSSFRWSPNSNQILAIIEIELQPKRAFLLETEALNVNPNEVTSTLEQITAGWEKQLANRQTSLLERFPKEVSNLTLEGVTSFSKDETAFLVVKADGSALVYDSQPTPVPGVPAETYNLPKADRYLWFQGDNKNIILIENNTLSLIDKDGTNRVNVFSGDFDPQAVYSWPDGSKLVISINLNSKSNPLPNLYMIGLN